MSVISGHKNLGLRRITCSAVHSEMHLNQLHATVLRIDNPESVKTQTYMVLMQENAMHDRTVHKSCS